MKTAVAIILFLVVVLAWCLCVGSLFAAFAFVWWTMDPSQWSFASRVLLAVLSAVITLAVIALCVLAGLGKFR